MFWGNSRVHNLVIPERSYKYIGYLIVAKPLPSLYFKAAYMVNVRSWWPISHCQYKNPAGAYQVAGQISSNTVDWSGGGERSGKVAYSGNSYRLHGVCLVDVFT